MIALIRRQLKLQLFTDDCKIYLRIWSFFEGLFKWIFTQLLEQPNLFTVFQKLGGSWGLICKMSPYTSHSIKWSGCWLKDSTRWQTHQKWTVSCMHITDKWIVCWTDSLCQIHSKKDLIQNSLKWKCSMLCRKIN